MHNNGLHGFNFNLDLGSVNLGTISSPAYEAVASGTSVNYPAGIAAGDLGVICYGGYDGANDRAESYFAPPAGYSLLARAYFESGAASICTFIATKTLDGTEVSESFPAVDTSREVALMNWKATAGGIWIQGDGENSSGLPPPALTMNAPAGTAPVAFIGMGLTLSGAPATDISMTGTPVYISNALVRIGSEAIASASSGSRVITHTNGGFPGLLCSGYISRA